MNGMARRIWLIVSLSTALVLTGCNSGSIPARPGGTETPAPQPPSGSTPVAGFDPKKHEQWEIPEGASPNRVPMKSTAMAPGMSAAPAGTTMDTYLNQKITWKPCAGFECGTVQVPLDWDKPSGTRITLKMLKVNHTSATKQGSMFINPGGPGGSGKEYAAGYKAENFPGYDIIGWDPRGSGESTPVVCWDDKAQDQYQLVDGSPDGLAEWISLNASNRSFAESCREKSGELLDHITTIDNVRDLDYLRYLVGDEKLTYNGVSYGTYVGSMYAELYPDRVGRMVLDSAVNITNKQSVIQAMGFDGSLKGFASWCAEQKCELGKTREAVIKTITDYWTQLDQTPAQVGNRILTQSMSVSAVALFMYWGTQGYQDLLDVLVAAIRNDNAQPMLRAADLFQGRDDKGHWDPITYSFPAIICADNFDGGVSSERAIWEYTSEKAPIFGTYFGPGGTCELWTAKAGPQLKLTAKGVAPILVAGATGDPATPYQQAEWMAEQLDSGVLLTWDGYGHGVYSLGNQCAKKVIEDYLNNGVVPTDGTKC